MSDHDDSDEMQPAQEMRCGSAILGRMPRRSCHVVRRDRTPWEDLPKAEGSSTCAGTGGPGGDSSVLGLMAPQLAQDLGSIAKSQPGTLDSSIAHPPSPDVFSYEGGRFLEASGSTQKDLRIKQLRECLEGILRPLHMEQYVEHFLQSDLSMDMLPQVSRKHIMSLGIISAEHQLKVMMAIKKYFGGGCKISKRHGDCSCMFDEPAGVNRLVEEEKDEEDEEEEVEEEEKSEEEEQEKTAERVLVEMPATGKYGPVSGYHEEPRLPSVPDETDKFASGATSRSISGAPDEEDGDITLVGQFGSSPATYSASIVAGDYLRIHVGPGCLRLEQTAGPILVKRDKRYLVECEGWSYLVSAVVDCQPSGSKFESSLIFDFRLGETAVERDTAGDGEGTDGDRWSGLDDEQRTQHMEELKGAYQVLQREEEGEPWSILAEEKTTIVYERGMFFFRAKIDHFSQGCLAKRIPLESASYEEVAWLRWRPRRKEVEFINATDRPLIFLVLPTSWSHSAVMSVAMSIAHGTELKAAISTASEKSILHEATDPQLLQIPCSSTAVASLRAGQACPFTTCTLPEKTGAEARIALITADSQTVTVWYYRVVKQRTRMVVLPRQFSEGMLPLLGAHNRYELEKGVSSLTSIALMSIAKGMQASGQRSPVSTI